MKSYVSILALLLALLLTLASCDALFGSNGETTPAEEVSTEDVTTEEITTEEVTTEEVTTEEITTEAEVTTEEVSNVISSKYLSLGDSIANGYGLTDKESTRYSALVAGALEITDVYSDAIDGQKSSDLLALVKENTYSGNSLITVSTGANNILGPASEVLMKMFVTPDVAFAELYSPEFQATLNAGVAQLQADLPEIIDTLRETNPDAQIVLLSVYNPFKGGKLQFTISGVEAEIPLGEMTETFVQKLNMVITAVAQAKGCLVADVYTAFNDSTEQMVNVEMDASGNINVFAYDPHPNAAGHAVIADCIKAVLPS